jgi:hypothetical protein
LWRREPNLSRVRFLTLPDMVVEGQRLTWPRLLGLTISINIVGAGLGVALQRLHALDDGFGILPLLLAWILFTGTAAMLWLRPSAQLGTENAWRIACWLSMLSAPIGIAIASNGEVFAGPWGILGGILSVAMAIAVPYLVFSTAVGWVFFRFVTKGQQRAAYTLATVFAMVLITAGSAILFATISCAGQC